ncbi:hypothetical protein [Hazenella coriacea]|uniref:Uncharacterized protein n=1 Tax=Hazenella coriacea TaxID=1179467 RepID=A0A4R3LA93_9BACL|nr:hypothetical protein [Hazenella coriacea]TCS96612.1 hypothetical protein EDD58_101248 [Hazenella coriacea]
MIALKILPIVMGLFTLAFAAFIPKGARLQMNLKEYSREYFEDDLKGYKDSIKGTKSIYSFDFILTVLFFIKETIFGFGTSFFIQRYPQIFLVFLGVCLMSVAILIQ